MYRILFPAIDGGIITAGVLGLLQSGSAWNVLAIIIGVVGLGCEYIEHKKDR